MREWLTVIIVLLIVAVVLDGLRRMRLSRRSTIRMSDSLSNNLNHQDVGVIDEVRDYGSELPGGGARVVNVRKAQDATERNTQIKQSAEYKRKTQLKSFRIPEQVSLNLDQRVPTLMESVPEPTRVPRDNSAYKSHRVIQRSPSRQVESKDNRVDQDDGRIEPIFATDDFDDNMIEDSNSLDQHNDPAEEYANLDIPSYSESRSNLAAEVNIPESKVNASEVVNDDEEEEDEIHYREPELVLTINVMAPKGERFPGADLLDIILNQGMRFGAMNIFHRHEQEDGDGEILYSMANIVVPGTFELAKMKTFTTPGVSFFLTLPMDGNSTDAFEDMLTTAKIIGARLHGELKDENRSVLTPQTITHYRSKLQEFARKQLSKAPV